jgi:hypothetical protein
MKSRTAEKIITLLTRKSQINATNQPIIFVVGRRDNSVAESTEAREGTAKQPQRLAVATEHWKCRIPEKKTQKGKHKTIAGRKGIPYLTKLQYHTLK